MDRKKVTSLPASLRARRFVSFLFFTNGLSLVLSGCSACDDEGGLTSNVCIPGDPVKGRNYTGKDDVCEGSIDDNCSGDVDEGCKCVNDTVRPCSDESRAGIGACVYGEERCVFNGVWGGCVGAGHPSREVCDGIDNDCDVGTDEGEDGRPLAELCLWNGRPDAVFGGVSICRVPERTCVSGGWGQCTGEVLNSTEKCDGRLDEDCNGFVDDHPDGEGTACGPAEERGACRRGVLSCLPTFGGGADLQCSDNLLTPFSEPVYPSEEACDGVDTDCDGVEDTDEGLIRPCTTSCGNGFETCVGAMLWNGCKIVVPTVEICDDGLDNDCDGDIDLADKDCQCTVGDVQPCFENIIGNPFSFPCGFNIQQCITITSSIGLAHTEWGVCQNIGVRDELCNGFDDDCDGAIDGQTVTCGSSVGLCRTGTTTCELGIFGPCVGEVVPTPEICDLEDNDCNELVDDGLFPQLRTNILFTIDWSGSMCPFIDEFVIAIQDFVNQFAGTMHRFGLVRVAGYSATVPVSVVTLEWMTPGFVDVSTFQMELIQLTCSGPGTEPMFPAIREVFTSTTVWDPDAFPFAVCMGDEDPNQTLTPISPMESAALLADVVALTTTCQMPGCQPPTCQLPDCTPGPPEVFVFTRITWFSAYTPMVNNTAHVTQRLFNIEDTGQYRNNLDQLLRNACRPSPP